jgi:O-antigen ligase
MLRFSTADTHAAGAQSQIKRESTINVGLDMFYDHPLTGVGLGNYQEVSRQIYRNRWFRPPHNSYVWALAEGGIFVFLAYVVLFIVTWRQIRAIMRVAHRDWEIAHMAAAMRITFLLCMFFSIFADLWLNPITYAMIGLVVSMHRVLEETRVVPQPVPATPAPGVLFALAR